MFGRVFLVAATIVAMHAAPAAAQIRIAAIGPITGSNAALGAQLRVGAELAVADINKAGGVLGQQLSLEVGDDACDPRQAVSVANQMASRGVKFVAGHMCSGATIAASKVYAEENVLQITPSATNPDYTDKGDWNTFRVCGRDDQQGGVAGAYMAREYKGKRVAILHDNSAYGRGLAEEVKRSINAAGITEVTFAAIVAGERDYSSVVSRLKAANTDAIYFGGYYAEAGLLVRQAKEQGLNAPLVGGDALVTTEFWQISGEAGAGTTMTYAPDPRLRPSSKPLMDAMATRNVPREGFMFYTYAAVQVWAAAANKAGTTDPHRVADALRSSGPWDSVVGPVAFDRKGDRTVADYVMYRWAAGHYGQM